MSNIIIGSVATLAGNGIDNLGLTFMKLSHRRLIEEQADDENANPPTSETDTPKGYFLTKRWMFGLFLYLIGQIFNAIALSYAPQSLFATLGSTYIVFNAFNSALILGEQLTVRIIVGTVLIFVGSVLAVVFGSDSDKTFNLGQLGDQFLKLPFLIYFIATVVLLTVNFMLIRMLEKRLQDIKFGNGYILLENPKREDDYRIALSFLYPTFSGIIGSYTALSAKASLDLLNNTFFDGNNQFMSAPSYFIVVLTLIIGVTQIHWLNRGLALYDQLIIVPTYTVVYTTFAILSGGTFYEEFDTFDTTAWLIFPLSVMVTFIGVWLICVPSTEDPFGGAHERIENRERKPTVAIYSDRAEIMESVVRKVSRKSTRNSRRTTETTYLNMSESTKHNNSKLRTQSSPLAY